MNNKYRESIGLKVKELREAKGLTSEKLAAIAEVSKSGLAYIERGVSDPRLSTLEKIADGLEIDLKLLFVD